MQSQSEHDDTTTPAGSIRGRVLTVVAVVVVVVVVVVLHLTGAIGANSH